MENDERPPTVFEWGRRMLHGHGRLIGPLIQGEYYNYYILFSIEPDVNITMLSFDLPDNYTLL